MAELRATISDRENRDVEMYRKKIRQTRAAFIRSAVEEKITKIKNAERGLDQVYVPAKFQSRTK